MGSLTEGILLSTDEHWHCHSVREGTVQVVGHCVLNSICGFMYNVCSLLIYSAKSQCVFLQNGRHCRSEYYDSGQESSVESSVLT